VSALPIRSQPSAVARAHDEITQRRSAIRVRVRELTTELRRLLTEDARLKAGEIAMGVETEEEGA
jgi:hypothetical protein